MASTTEPVSDHDLAEFRRALAADRRAVLDFLRDVPAPAEPVDEYVTDPDERWALFDELRQLHQGRRMKNPIVATLAVFAVAPIPQIRAQLASIRNTHPPEAMEKRLHEMGDQAMHAMSSYMPSYWATVPPQPPMRVSFSTMLLIDPGDEARAEMATRSVSYRDANTCLLSGRHDPEAVLIFPFAASGTSEHFAHLGALLEAFWGADKAREWRRVYENRALAQSEANYLSLDRQLRHWFGKARFALKPLSQTATSITVQFHWLRRHGLSPSSRVDDHATPFFRSAAGLGSTPRGTTTTTTTTTTTPAATWGDGMVAHRRSGVRLQTGQTFVVEVRNPALLPSFGLLELQWNLQRVAAICGAGSTRDDEARGEFDLDGYLEMAFAGAVEGDVGQTRAALEAALRELPPSTTSG